MNARDGLGSTPFINALFVGRISPRVVRLLIDAGADTTSVVRLTEDAPNGSLELNDTPLTATIHQLREKKVRGNDATEEQLNSLEGIRQLLLQVEAVHAVSWLWHNDNPLIGRTTEDLPEAEIVSTPLRTMLLLLSRRARRRGVLLAALFR